MNAVEFKAWFEGFTENMEGPPNAKDWKKICEKIGSMKSSYPYPHLSPYYPVWNSVYGSAVPTLSLNNNSVAEGASS